jgi:5-methylcytosine-specific restriction endonuclease McrA
MSTQAKASKASQVSARDGPNCHYCSTPLNSATRTLDHVTPVSQGGGNNVENLRLACKPCNQGRVQQQQSSTKHSREQMDRSDHFTYAASLIIFLDLGKSNVNDSSECII